MGERTINRRQLVGAMGAISAALPIQAKPSTERSDFSAEELASDIETYARFGSHQTGSKGDLATVDWISKRLRSLGYNTTLNPVEVPYFEPRKVGILHNENFFRCIPQHPVTPTPTQPVEASLVERRSDLDDEQLQGNIAVITLPFARHSTTATPSMANSLLAAKTAGAAGVVLITDGPTRLAIALNAELAAPFAGIPIVVMGSKDAPAIHALARKNTRVRLIIDGASGRRSGYNVIARRQRNGKSLVLTTPLSGWFQCAGERGSGIAAWLAIAKWLAANYPQLSLVVAGFVGHEFENHGSKYFMRDDAPPPSEVGLWLHVGSGFATRDWHEAGPGSLWPLPSADPQRFLIAANKFLPLVKTAMAGVPGMEQPYEATSDRAAGEAKAILEAGYTQLIANFGGHRFHHTENDGPETTSGMLTAHAANAMRVALSDILRNAW